MGWAAAAAGTGTWLAGHLGAKTLDPEPGLPLCCDGKGARTREDAVQSVPEMAALSPCPSVHPPIVADASMLALVVGSEGIVREVVREFPVPPPHDAISCMHHGFP